MAFAEFYCLLHNKSGYEALWDSWQNSRKEQWQLLGGLILIPVAIVIPLLLLESFLNLLGLAGPVFTFVSGILSSIRFPGSLCQPSLYSECTPLIQSDILPKQPLKTIKA